MTYDEVVENIGTIAKSGTAGFLEAATALNKPDILTPELIGQFGVGFYSAFIVAERVTIVTKAAGSDKATKWESTGDGAYTIEETEKEGRGTTVILSLRKAERTNRILRKNGPSAASSRTFRLCGLSHRHGRREDRTGP